MISRIYEVRSKEEVWAELGTVIYFNKDVNCLKCWTVNTDNNYIQDGGGGGVEAAGL
jgi:hypothetical protein